MKKVLFLSAVVVGLAFLSVRAEDAKAIYDSKCALCHGKDGAGKAPLKTKNYTDATVQDGLKDEDLTKAIKEGVKGSKMKAYDKLSDDDIKALVAYIRAFKK